MKKTSVWHYFWENLVGTVALIAICVGIVLFIHTLAWLCGWWTVPILGIIFLIWMCWQQAEEDAEKCRLRRRDTAMNIIDNLFHQYCTIWQDNHYYNTKDSMTDETFLSLTSNLEAFRHEFGEDDPYYVRMSTKLKDFFDIDLSEL